MSSAEVRGVLDEIEMTNAKIHGYGSKNYARNLEQCYQHLAERHIAEADLKAVQDLPIRFWKNPLS